MRPLGAEAAALPTQSTPLTAPLAHAASSKVRAIARLGEPVAPLVIEDFEPHPAYDPVIGPDLAAARTRVGLSVDELADRTRIRPHVIESIEVDDFTPCGGDFYARGHIRTLARVLGKDPAPMLAAFDSRYATAPDQPPPRLRGRAGHRSDRQHAQHPRRPELGAHDRRGADARAGLERRAALLGRLRDRLRDAAAGPQRVLRHRQRLRRAGGRGRRPRGRDDPGRRAGRRARRGP